MAEMLVLGDSHSRALHVALVDAGIDADMMAISGASWHAGLLGHSPRRGLVGRKTIARLVADLRQRNGGSDLTDGSVPVVASFGFHLGRLVPPFGFLGHRATPEEAAEDGTLYASEAFVAQYVRHHRATLIAMLAQIGRRAPLVNVAPPVPDRPNYRRFKSVLLSAMARAGVATFDPEREIFGGRVPPEFMEPDGIHGNALYGAAVVAALADLGFLRAV